MKAHNGHLIDKNQYQPAYFQHDDQRFVKF